MIERRASVLQKFDAAQAERLAPYDAKGLPVEEQARPDDAVAEADTSETAYLEIDGVVPNTREPIPGEQLSQADKLRLERKARKSTRRQRSPLRDCWS
jgi:hypothetical protein